VDGLNHGHVAVDGSQRRAERAAEIFSEVKRNFFWVVELDWRITGMFGIASCSEETTELRRMYLDRPYRGRGIAQRMLQCGEA
jgi:GNAT superfamily N-acetyltransferase